MKRNALALAALAAALATTGCASMWKTMGVVTEKSMTEREAASKAKVDEIKRSIDEREAAQNASTSARMDELKSSIDDLSVKIAMTQEIARSVERIEEGLGELKGKVDQLPRDTLKKLAEILDKAAAEIGSKDPVN
jgi:TolA-binding protein